jgi:hypothetical protein
MLHLAFVAAAMAAVHPRGNAAVSASSLCMVPPRQEIARQEAEVLS